MKMPMGHQWRTCRDFFRPTEANFRAILSDNGNIAVVEVGEMDYYRCRSTCASLPGAWSIVNENTVGIILDNVEAEVHFEATHTDSGTSVWYLYPDGESYQTSQNNTNSPRRGPASVTPSSAHGLSTATALAELQARKHSINASVKSSLKGGTRSVGFRIIMTNRGTGQELAPKIFMGNQSQTHASFWRWEQ